MFLDYLCSRAAAQITTVVPPSVPFCFLCCGRRLWALLCPLFILNYLWIYLRAMANRNVYIAPGQKFSIKNGLLEVSTPEEIDLFACRVCLATDIKLFDIHECDLAESYETVLGFPVSFFPTVSNISRKYKLDTLTLFLTVLPLSFHKFKL